MTLTRSHAVLQSLPMAAPSPARRPSPGLLCLPPWVFAIALLQPHAVAETGAPLLVRQPFAPPSAPRGATLFAELPPEQTGIVTENRYADPRMWGDLYHEFEVGPIGTGVAIGDYDGDGRPDLFVVSKTESCRLFRNLGDWKFEDVTARAGVEDRGDAARIWKQGATFADVNNDGRLDLYVCRFAAPNLLYLNKGDGTFREAAAAAGLAVADASTMAAFCDYDRDGWLDVFLQTNLLDNAKSPLGQRDYLFHNNGNGTFSDVTVAAVLSTAPTQGNSATWWDYNGDGWPDLYVANDFAVPDFLYRNNGDGTFTNVIDAAVPHLPFSAMGSDLGDVNNDSRLDLLVADMAASSHEKDQRTMADNRSRAREPGDASSAAPNYLWSALYLNTGLGVCQEAARLAGLEATDWTWSPRFEDLDNDGRIDLHVTNGMHREIHNTDLLQRLMGTESALDRVRIARNSPILAEPNLAFRNLGDLQFENVSAAWGLNQKGVSFGSALGDLDGDGDLDLVFSNFLQGATVLRNDSATGQRLVVALRGTRSNRFGVGATIRIDTARGPQVRTIGLARGYMSSSEPIAHFGLGDDTVVQRLTVTWPNGTVQTFENLAAGARYVVTEPTNAGLTASTPAPAAAETLFEEISQQIGFSLTAREDSIDELAMQPLLPFRQNRRGPALAVGDLNGDDRDDLLLGGTPRDPARLLIASDSDAFALVGNFGSEHPNAVNDGPVAMFDANADGAPDVLITKGGSAYPSGSPEYQPQLFLSDGAGGLRAATDALPSFRESAGAVAIADIDRDGRLDVFIGGRVSPGEYPFPPASALWLNRGGRFEDVTDALAPRLRSIGLVTSALWTDIDEDGWPDLLLTLEWGQVTCLRNAGGRGFEDWTSRAGFAEAGTGAWTALACADFNGDGHLDYAVGNLGLNTPYRADAAHPALLFALTPTEGGAPSLIEGYYEGDKLYPRRSRRDLRSALPALLKQFPRNDTYARATLEEIVGREKLAATDRFAMTELRSGVFLSEGPGRFRFAPLPRVAQIAPLQGLVAGDFDGDGRADLCAVQNSYAPAPVIGRFDGGLGQLLRGDGRGGFDAAPPANSGIVVRGDAKALVVSDLDRDGRADLLVTRNQAPTLAFRNRGVPGSQMFGVRLRGPTGNPTAIGAVLTLSLADGARQVAQVSAGSGYYSQSSAELFFGYEDSNRPRQLRIRWPDGTATEHVIPEDAKNLVIAASTHP